MFFKKKKVITLLNYKNAMLKAKANQRKVEVQTLREELQFIEEKLNSFDCLLKIYCVDNKMYGIFLNMVNCFYIRQ